MNELDNDVEEISSFLTKKQADFDKIMQLSREIIRDAGQTITLMHNNDNKSAEARLKEMTKKVNMLQGIDQLFKYNTLQAYQEYAEAFIFMNIKMKKKIPKIKEVKVDNDAYLMGLMDVEGELKREILEALRIQKIKEAEWYFDIMKQIYDSTRRLRFAEAVLGGFRKKQDVARIQIENAGSEILMFKSRR
jgi:translin